MNQYFFRVGPEKVGSEGFRIKDISFGPYRGMCTYKDGYGIDMGLFATKPVVGFYNNTRLKSVSSATETS